MFAPQENWLRNLAMLQQEDDEQAMREQEFTELANREQALQQPQNALAQLMQVLGDDYIQTPERVVQLPRRTMTDAQPMREELGDDVISAEGKKGRWTKDRRAIVFPDGSRKSLDPHSNNPMRTYDDLKNWFEAEQKKNQLVMGDLQVQRGRQGMQNEQRRMQLAEQRANGRGQGSVKSAPAGYRFSADGQSLEAIPGGPAEARANAANTKANEKETAKVEDAKSTLDLVTEAEKILPNATGSGVGMVRDKLGAMVGMSTDGAKAAAQLKVIGGQLTSKMPRMQGPQSNYDVKLYQEMAGQVGDESIPVEQRMAALQTIRKLNEKYAGAQPSAQPNGDAGKVRRYNPATGRIE